MRKALGIAWDILKMLILIAMAYSVANQQYDMATWQILMAILCSFEAYRQN
jgi:hypothetical protein